MSSELFLKITIEDFRPGGFHHYAAEYLRAAKCLEMAGNYDMRGNYSPVPYFLYCKSIELVLKAFLLAKRVSMKILVDNIGHDLERALKRAIRLGLNDIVVVSSSHKEELGKANYYYRPRGKGKGKGFEYFDMFEAERGYPALPNLEVLSEFASALVVKLEKVCIESNRGKF